MNKSKHLLPEIRFQKFVKDGDWLEKKLGDIADFINGRAYKQNELLTKGKYRVLRVGNFFTNNEWYYSDLELDEDKYCDKGDLLYAWSASFDSQMWDEEKVIYHYHIWKVENKNKINRQFLFYLLDYETFKMKSNSLNGFALMHITKNTIENWKSVIPKTEQEQQKIASCLSSIDEMVAAHNQKLQTLKVHKKGLMQNLFPQDGEKVPKFRFPEFVKDGEWSEQKLGNCLLQRPEYGINAPAVSYSEDLPTYLRITDISKNGVYVSSNKVSVDREVSEENYLVEGDIVLARTGASVGKSYKYKKNDGRLVFAGFLIRVKPDPEKLDSELLFQFLSSDQYWKWVSFISARSGQPGINGTEYSSMPINLPPKLEEQQKIASCLSTLDELITAQANKIEQLKLHKKGIDAGIVSKDGGI